jgi:hypothetical protein
MCLVCLERDRMRKSATIRYMPWDRDRYPSNWEEIVQAIAVRSRGCCECSGECEKHSGSCRALNHEAHPNTGALVILTTAHLWRGPCRDHHDAGIKCGDPAHLKHMCQRCHLAYDRELHTHNARVTRFRSKAHSDLFDGPHPNR